MTDYTGQVDARAVGGPGPGGGIGEKPHVVVLGLGIAGSAIAATLAVRGCRVTGIEQFSPLHERGSSHGDTRIFRRVPHEGAVYVELAAASYAGWHGWNGMAKAPLFLECGGVDAGPEWSAMVQAAEELCRQYEQPFEAMAGAEFNRRYGRFRLPARWRVIHQPRGGVVLPDATRSFLHGLAKEHGATLRHESAVLGMEARADGVSVRTAGETIRADYLVVAAGGWLPRLLPELVFPVSTERRVLAWFDGRSAEAPIDGRMPIFVLDADGGWYGMPAPGGLVKIGHDKHLRERIDPEAEPIAPSAEDEALLSRCASRYLVGLGERPVSMKPCMYTLSADHHFLIDRHPAHANVLIFSCCSGHGFKYAPAYGEIAANLIAGGDVGALAGMSLSRSGAAATRFGA